MNGERAMKGEVGIFGSVGILNVGNGDTKLSFDPKNPQERIRAARIVKDMIRRGYALLVEVERNGVKKFERATDFREDTCEYIIADFDPVTAEKADADEEAVATAAAPGGESGAETPPASNSRGGGRRKAPERAVDATRTRAVAVARSAGG